MFSLSTLCEEKMIVNLGKQTFAHSLSGLPLTPFTGFKIIQEPIKSMCDTSYSVSINTSERLLQIDMLKSLMSIIV